MSIERRIINIRTKMVSNLRPYAEPDMVVRQLTRVIKGSQHVGRGTRKAINNAVAPRPRV